MAEINLAAVWAKILRSLRESKNFALFGLLSNMDDVAFGSKQITLRLHNEAEESILKNHLALLKNLAGEGVEIVLQAMDCVVPDEQQDYVARLKELFGDKVKIV